MEDCGLSLTGRQSVEEDARSCAVGVALCHRERRRLLGGGRVQATPTWGPCRGSGGIEGQEGRGRVSTIQGPGGQVLGPAPPCPAV